MVVGIRLEWIDGWNELERDFWMDRTKCRHLVRQTERSGVSLSMKPPLRPLETITTSAEDVSSRMNTTNLECWTGSSGMKIGCVSY